MRCSRSSAGQSLIEFALIFPLLFLLVTGLFDLGRAVFDIASLNNAVREGTRWAIVQPKGSVSNTDVIAKVKSYAFAVKDLNDSMITVSSVGTTEDPQIRISISYLFKPITPGIIFILGKGNGIPIDVQSTMRLAPIAQ